VQIRFANPAKDFEEKAVTFSVRRPYTSEMIDNDMALKPSQSRFDLESHPLGF
jgi:hypothetical protein